MCFYSGALIHCIPTNTTDFEWKLYRQNICKILLHGEFKNSCIKHEPEHNIAALDERYNFFIIFQFAHQSPFNMKINRENTYKQKAW